MAMQFRQALPGVLARIRTDAGISQEEMASRLGVSRQSVRAYEAGQSFIRTDYLFLWASACGREVAVVVDEAAHPEKYAPGAAVDVDAERDVLAEYVRRTASPEFIQAAHTITFRTQREAIMQLFLAYLCLPLQLAWRHARAILEDYRFAERTGQLQGSVRPDMGILCRAVESGTVAAADGKETYELEEAGQDGAM